MKREVKVKNLIIGGNAPVSVQSMTNTKTLDYNGTLAQIRSLQACGCDIVRLAVSSMDEVQACKNIVGKVDVALVADIQFDYRLAVACADIGFDKIRFNPGNIGDESRVKEVVTACKRNGVPIRVGVNGGSLDKSVSTADGLARALADSALKHVRLLEKYGFYDTVISVKSSDVRTMVDAYTTLHNVCDYPLHLGVTESGSIKRGTVKSAVGIGALLLNGIGNTIRVSLTGEPECEVEAARLILQSLDLGGDRIQIVSCPTCSRTSYDMVSIVNELEEKLGSLNKKLKIAVMGCVVNGPGEAKDADIAVCGGSEEKAVIYLRGKVLKTVHPSEVTANLLALVQKM